MSANALSEIIKAEREIIEREIISRGKHNVEREVLQEELPITP
jgi:hypothetical protein